MPHVVSRQHMNEVHLAAYLGDLDRLENVLRDHPHNVEVVDDDGRTPFLYSCLMGNHDAAALLVRFGANIFTSSNHGYTALHMAVMQPDKHFVQWLLDEGCDVNGVNHIGRSPLHYACQAGHGEVADLLLSRNASPTLAAKNGDQAMHMAARHHHLFCVRLLRDHRADINAANKLEHTPLHVACSNGDVMMVDYLLDHGADASAVSMHNDTPFELVPPHQRDAMRDVFERHGKDVDAILKKKEVPTRDARVSSRPSLVLSIPEKSPEKCLRSTPRHTLSSQGDDFSDCLEDSTDGENRSDVVLDDGMDPDEDAVREMLCTTSDDGDVQASVDHRHFSVEQVEVSAGEQKVGTDLFSVGNRSPISDMPVNHNDSTPLDNSDVQSDASSSDGYLCVEASMDMRNGGVDVDEEYVGEDTSLSRSEKASDTFPAKVLCAASDNGGDPHTDVNHEYALEDEVRDSMSEAEKVPVLCSTSASKPISVDHNTIQRNDEEFTVRCESRDGADWASLHDADVHSLDGHSTAEASVDRRSEGDRVDDECVADNTSFKLSVSESSEFSRSEKGSDVFSANVVSPSTLSSFSVSSLFAYSPPNTKESEKSVKEVGQLRGIMIPLHNVSHDIGDDNSVVSDLTGDDNDYDDEGSLALSIDAAAMKISTRSHSNANSSFQSYGTSQCGNISSDPSHLSTMSSSSVTPQGASVDVMQSDHSDDILSHNSLGLHALPLDPDDGSIKSLKAFSSTLSAHRERSSLHKISQDNVEGRHADDDNSSASSTFLARSHNESLVDSSDPRACVSAPNMLRTSMTCQHVEFEKQNDDYVKEAIDQCEHDEDSIKSLTTFGSRASNVKSEEDVLDEATLLQLAQSSSDTSSVFSISSHDEHPAMIGITPRTENTESTTETAFLTYSPCASPAPHSSLTREETFEEEDGNEDDFAMSARLVSFSKLHPNITEEKCFIDENPIKEDDYISDDESEEAYSLERYGDFTEIYADVPRTSAFFTQENPDLSDAESSVTVDMDFVSEEGEEDADSVAVEFDYDRKSRFNQVNPTTSPSVDSHGTEGRLSGVSVSTINDDASHSAPHDHVVMDVDSERSHDYSSDTPDVDSIILSDRSISSYVPVAVASPSPSPPATLTPLAQRIAMYNMATKKSSDKEASAAVLTTVPIDDALLSDPSLLTVKEKTALFSKPIETTPTRSQRSAMIVGKLDISALAKAQSPVERKPSHSSLIFDLISGHDGGDDASDASVSKEETGARESVENIPLSSPRSDGLTGMDIPTERLSSSSSLNFSPHVDEIPVERLSSSSSLQDTMLRHSSDHSMLDAINERPSSASGAEVEEAGFVPLLELDTDLLDAFPEEDEPLSSRNRNKNRRRKSDGGITLRRTPRTPTSIRRSSIGTGMRLSDTSASSDKSPRDSSTSTASDGVIETRFAFSSTELEESFPSQPENKSIHSRKSRDREKKVLLVPSDDIVAIDESFEFGVQEKVVAVPTRKSFTSNTSSISPDDASKPQRASLPVLPLSPESNCSLVKITSVGRSRRSRSMFRACSRHTITIPETTNITEDENSCCESVVTYDNHFLMSPTSIKRKQAVVSSKSMSEADAVEPSIPRYHRSSCHMLPVRTKFSYVEFGGSYKVNSKVKDKAAKEYALLAAELSRGDEEIAAELRAWNALGPRAYMSQPEDTKSQLEKALDEIDNTSQGSLGSTYSISLNNFVDVSIQKTLEIQWRLSQLESKMYNSSSIYEIRRLLNKKTKLFQKLKGKIKDESVVMDLDEVQRLRSDINNVRRQCLNVIRQEVSICKDPESVIVEEYRTIANI